MGGSSEPAGFVDHVLERLPAQEAPTIVEQDVVAAIVEVRTVAGSMRRDEHTRHGPQRMVGWQRLLLEHVEARPRDLSRRGGCGTTVEPRGHAGPDVDEERAVLHRLEARTVH